MMPYQRNPHFIGRDELLQQIHQTLCETKPKKFNHRLAIYGMGGVGKTQIAIEYVYRFKDYYKMIFWISAATEATLFSGSQEIATRTQCVPENSNLKPSEIVKRVLSWLNEQEKWLLVIDNLDDVTVVDGYLQILSESSG